MPRFFFVIFEIHYIAHELTVIFMPQHDNQILTNEADLKLTLFFQAGGCIHVCVHMHMHCLKF